jgi:hypothetical protein
VLASYLYNPGKVEFGTKHFQLVSMPGPTIVAKGNGRIAWLDFEASLIGGIRPSRPMIDREFEEPSGSAARQF